MFPPPVGQRYLALIFSELARSDGTETEEVLMIDAADLKRHSTASSLQKVALRLALISRTIGG